MPVIDGFANISHIEAKLINFMHKVKVIVTISSYTYFSQHFLKSVERMAAVLLFYDNTIVPRPDSLNQTVGSLYITFQRYANPDFVNWYNNLTADTVTKVPYGRYIWRSVFNCCATAEAQCAPCDVSKQLTPLQAHDIVVPAARIIDALSTYGHAMTTLASRKCFQAVSARNITGLNECLDGAALYKAVLETSFQVSDTTVCSKLYLNYRERIVGRDGHCIVRRIRRCAISKIHHLSATK